MAIYRTAILSILLLLSCKLNAQNWKTVRLNDTTWFTAGTLGTGGLLRVMWIDSFQLSGADTAYYFYRSIRDTSAYAGNGWCADSVAPGWLGEKFIRRDDGHEVYFNGLGDSLLIKALDTVGSSWVFYGDSATNCYWATITATGVTNIDGVQDSIKTISLSAQGTVSGLYNNVVLVLSKNHGWIKTLDLYNFENYFWSWASYGAQNDQAQHERLPRNVGEIDLTIQSPFAKYQPGNEWIRKSSYTTYHASSPPTVNSITYTHDSVISVQQVSANSITVTMQVKTYEKLPGSAHDTIYIATFNVTSGTGAHPLIQTHLPEFNWHLIYIGTGAADRYNTIYEIDTFCNSEQHIISRRTADDGVDQFTYFNSCLYAGGPYNKTSSSSYLQGFGDLSYYNAAQSSATWGEFVETQWYHPYIKLGNCESGQKIDVIALGVEEQLHAGQAVMLYPSPANDKLYIKGLEGRRVQLLLCDVTGRKQADVMLSDDNSYADVSQLSTGYYIAQMTVDDLVRFQKVLIAH